MKATIIPNNVFMPPKTSRRRKKIAKNTKARILPKYNNNGTNKLQPSKKYGIYPYVVLVIIFAEFLFNLVWFVSLPQIRFIPFFVGGFYAHKSWGSRFVCVIYKGHESPTSNRILKNPSGSHRRKQAISAYDVTMKSHAAGIHIPSRELLVRRRFETVLCFLFHS